MKLGYNDQQRGCWIQYQVYSLLAHLIPGCVTLGKLLNLFDFYSL